MKILQINKFYYPKGGSERHFFELVDVLEKKGHEVIVFSTENKKNVKRRNKEYFISETKMSLGNFRRGLNLFYNREAMRELKKIISENRPDVAHLHNISHHFSPAIIKFLKKNNIPVVMTAHDYKLTCPNYKLFNSKGICNKCIGEKYYQCTLNKCIKNSYLASFTMTLEAYWMKWKKYFSYVDIFIAPSKFMKSKLIEGGYEPSKIKYIPNFLDGNSEAENINGENFEKYILFFGRLSREKGIDVLLRAFPEIKDKNIKLKIAGDGEAKSDLIGMARKLNIFDRVNFLGHKSKREVKDLIGKSLFVVVPSVWYENAPYSILESYEQEKAVVGSDLGGIKEMIIDGKTGLIFKGGDNKDLKEKIDYMLRNIEDVSRMEKKGKKLLKERFNSDRYYKRILRIYERIVK